MDIVRPDPALSGVILAGGGSTRLGRDKALLELEGRTLVARTLDSLARLTDDLIVVTNLAPRLVPPPARVVADRYVGAGVLAGVHAGLLAARGELAIIVAYCLAYLTGLATGEPYLGATRAIAEGKVGLTFAQAFFRGLGCNWLVCLGVWLAIASDDITGKIWGLWFPIMAFVGLGFEHSIANMFFIPLGMFNGANVSVGQLLFTNLLPVTLGNIVGGAGFVGCIYWWLYGRD